MGWRCPACGLRHIFATCSDVIPFSQWATMSQDKRALGFLQAQIASMERRGLVLPRRRIHVEPGEDTP